jgi:biotin synthase
MLSDTLDRNAILQWLRESSPERLAKLWVHADSVRVANVGYAVHLRGLVEISSHCARQCGYCGLRAGNTELKRYRMRFEEIVQCAHEAVKLGYGTVVMQGGEDPGLDQDFIADVVRQVKSETPLAVTLSLGERAEEDLVAWRNAGADRYLLRFETSDRTLYDRIHPPRGDRPSDRIAMLRQLQAIGYETGSGIMVGIPGQSYQSVVEDLMLFRELDLDMIGIGPYIPHPQTPLGRAAGQAPHPSPLPEGEGADAQGLEARVTGSGAEQIPGDELMVYRLIALTRILCPDANIPATTALATINRKNGRELGLMRGANVIMPNLTPVKYRAMYEIYPDKACVSETATQCNGCLRRRIASIGRVVGNSTGSRKKQYV